MSSGMKYIQRTRDPYESPPMSNERPNSRRPTASRLVDHLLSLLAVAGSLCIVLVVLGAFFQISIMMFRTGSMSPTITAGSIAFVREMPATQIAVGDIVTVEQKHATLPVTHRVVEIFDVDNSTGLATFTMKGDANESLDAAPYTVLTVKRVLFSIPDIAPVIQWFGNPKVIGSLTLGAASLVVWAFWPRRSDDDKGKLSQPANLSVALPAFLLAAMLLDSSAPSTDLSTAKIVTGDYLSIESSGNIAKMRNLSPGSQATWRVDVWSTASTPGQIELSISVGDADAALSSLMVLNITGCKITAEQSSVQGCPDGTAEILHQSDLASLQQDSAIAPLPLGSFGTEDRQRLLITGSLSESAVNGSTRRGQAPLIVTAKAAEETISMPFQELPKDPHKDERNLPDLPPTGIDGWQWVIISGLVFIVAGTTMFRRRSRGGP